MRSKFRITANVTINSTAHWRSSANGTIASRADWLRGDILAIVADSSDENSYIPDLEAVGYVLRVRELKMHEHRMLRTPSRSAHVHVFSSSAPEIDRYLMFRDRLRKW